MVKFGFKVGSWVLEVIFIIIIFGLILSGREMEDELILIERVIFSGGSCMSEDMEVGIIKGFFL